MKDINYYLGLPYTVVLRRDEEGDFVARVDELPGCVAHGKTPHQALKRVEEAKALWITDSVESGDIVPEPDVEETLPSGKWVQRVPRSLHRKLVLFAKREKVSLNQLVTSILSEAAGVRKAQADPAIEGKAVVKHMRHLFDIQDFFKKIEQGASDWVILHDLGRNLPVLPTLRGKLGIQEHIIYKLESAEDAYEKEAAHQLRR